MHLRTLLCSTVLTAFFSVPALAAETPIEVFSFLPDEKAAVTVECKNSRILTEDFSFRIPEEWHETCILVSNGTSYDIFEKTAYEKDGSGLLFSIRCSSQDSLSSADSSRILGFNGDLTYFLESYCESADLSEKMLSSCENAEELIRKSFLSYIRSE